MATGKVLNAANSSFSLSGGFRSIFSCCFATPTSTNRGREAEEGAHDKGADAGDKDGREEEFTRTRRVRNPSEQDSTAYDEFRDSAIDSASLTSQFNLRGSVDGETMKTGESFQPDEEISHHGNRNVDLTEQYDTQYEQESNAAASTFLTDVERTDAGEGDLGEGVADAVEPTEVDHQDGEAGDLEDATAAVVNADRAHPPAIQCGRVRLTLTYEAGRQRLALTIHEAIDIPEPDRVNLSHSQVHLLLLPATRKIRHRTKAKTGENPKFEETFRLKLSTDDLEGDGFRLRLYRSEKFKKERMIGENYVSFSSIPFDQGAAYSTWIKLQPRINITVIGSPSSDGAVEMDIQEADGGVTAARGPLAATAASSSSGSHPLELMLGIAYNATTGRLSVEVVQGCNIKSPDSQKPPDTYVKLRLIAPNGQEITRCKTTVRRSQPNPLYKETFMFHISKFQLPDVSLMVSVFEHRNLKHNKMLGWCTLGHTNSTEETKKHWMAMIESQGEQIARWQALLNP